MKTLILICSLLLCFSSWAFEDNPHAQATLQSLQKDGKTYLAAIYKNDPHWHTYWKNPGDAGTALEMKFEAQGKPLFFNELEWPTPKVYFDQGDLLAFGYDGEYALFFELSEEQVKKLENQKLIFRTKWLICDNQCIWGEKQIEGKLTKGTFQSNESAAFHWSKEQLLKALQDLPQEASWPTNLNFKMHFAQDKENLVARYSLASQTAPAKDQILLIPFPSGPFLFKHETLATNQAGKIVGTVPVTWTGQYLEPEVQLPPNGQLPHAFEQKFLFFAPGDTKAVVIKTGISSIELTPPPALLEKSQAPKETGSIFFYLLLAFIGGLILNLMPCVFPVISLKLFGLIKKREDSPRSILVHNLFYSLGVFASFFTLALFIIFLKKGGEQVGWGFQLQSPLFISFIVIILFIFAVNLFGLFEFKTPGGRLLGNIKLGEHYYSHFFEGVIATILATPCSAPFLGTALTFAFSSSDGTILLVFSFIALGLSFPFILVGIFPALIKVFPRPGNWMGNLRKFLGLTLIFTIIWLLGILLRQTDNILGFQYLLLTLTLIFFAIFFSIKISPRFIYRVLFASLVSLALYGLISSSLTSQESTLKWGPWTLDGLSKKEKVIFMDFTADWCLTCKVNEAVVLRSEEFKDLVKKYDLELLVADWTKKDENIGKFLNENGSNAVPAYFIQDKKGKLHALGETISIEKIENILKEISENK